MTIDDKPADPMVIQRSNNMSSSDCSEDDQRMRLDSESSTDDSLCIEPLDFDDVRRYNDLGDRSHSTLQPATINNLIKENKKTRRKRLDSLDAIDEYGDPKVTLFSVAMSLRRKEKGKPMPLALRPQTRATKNWLKALHLTRERVDPWEKFHLSELPVEKAVRHRFNALTQTWSTEEVLVKMEKESFAAGAMRECFRMKKLSNFSQNQDWSRDSNNYVAKSYMENDTPRTIYFEDVKLQMDAKLWGEEFNRHNPPKKVDIFMMAVLEMVERPGAPLFHVEHYIDGEYVKYNSNSGFVDNRLTRQTPHAFSHFTFERSGHELIVVDVQGVGDLYTDPQIHTAEGTEYGDGNLGVKGMALFFHTHSCNQICKSLGLEQFDLAPKEKDEIKSTSSSVRSTSQTVLRGDEVMCESPSESDRADHFGQFFRNRSNSMSIDLNRSISSGSANDMNEEVFDVESNKNRRRQRLTTEMDDNNENDLKSFQDKLAQISKPSNLSSELMADNSHDDSILGQVHLALAKYHEVCRFTDDGTYDKEAAMFHLKAAAECGIIAAIVAVAKMYCGLPHDILSEVTVDVEDGKRGLNFMEKAAQAMDRQAMVFMARSYDLGVNGADKDLDIALYWYESIAAFDEDEGAMDTDDMSLDDPPYIMLARLAELWLSGLLKQGRDANKAGELYNQAAESAMAAMKGKLSNKYYMLAEEAWSEIEE